MSLSEMNAKPEAAERRKTADFRPDLAVIRAMSTVIPGALPLAVNGVRVAASIRPRKFVIEGGDDTPVTMPRTAFQIVYSDCSVMIDSGLDKATHDSFSPDKPEPYFAEQFARLERALANARLIVLTHHHADHVAGVLCAANFSELAGKTVITMDVADCMMNTPHRPHLKLASPALERFIVLDYPQYYPVAPGVVLIRSPGHSPDSQMVFIRLQSGREILHSVDSAWIMDNITQSRGKAAPWVKEDVPAVMAQLRWLNTIAATENNITILVTHDDELFERLTRNGSIGGELAI
ncbi:MAG TPA: MBL fold metallo-hydrolase [Xanthobacteraceae bacterium]|jgi:glyoxylase-like metal-dependent hydrolase (beta-lactamase superfamily II)